MIEALSPVCRCTRRPGEDPRHRFEQALSACARVPRQRSARHQGFEAVLWNGVAVPVARRSGVDALAAATAKVLKDPRSRIS